MVISREDFIRVASKISTLITECSEIDARVLTVPDTTKDFVNNLLEDIDVVTEENE